MIERQTIPATPEAVVIGGGPAGLMAAERLLQAGVEVHVFEQKRTPGRKFLLAGKGGLNLTHAEELPDFYTRYQPLPETLLLALRCFGRDALRDWVHEFGISTFVGSSGRVFPEDMKAAPLLRAWLKRLKSQGMRLHTQMAWQGFTKDGGVVLHDVVSQTQRQVKPSVCVLACGGASWPELGSDGYWQQHLSDRVSLSPLVASNVGYTVAWSSHLRERFAGEALKSVGLRCGRFWQQGELLISDYGLEGSLLYAASSALREHSLPLTIELDLLPDLSHEALLKRLSLPRAKRSFSTHLKRCIKLPAAKLGLLRECVPHCQSLSPEALARALKALPVQLESARPIAEAISSAGGVCVDSLDSGLGIHIDSRSSSASAGPKVFCCGEMLDWDAPTGGYLLSACFASGALAGDAAAEWLQALANDG